MLEAFIKAALAEDIGRGDLFGRIAYSKPASARIVSKSSGILAGVVYADELARLLDIGIEWQKSDGQDIKEGDLLARVFGDSSRLLAAERTLLNILLHASGIATNVNRYVVALKGFGVRLLDTRKTRPLLRNFEKYAARVGGAINHRMGLDDCLMLKDTHLATIDDLASFVANARKEIPFTASIEIECETIAAALEAMEAGADIVMCDNMLPEDIRKVVEYKNSHYSSVLIEASGNINLENIREYALTGVDAISSGSLIHQATWLDFSMKFD